MRIRKAKEQCYMCMHWHSIGMCSKKGIAKASFDWCPRFEEDIL